MKRKRAEKHQRNPLPIQFGDEPQRLASEASVMEVVAIDQELVEAAAFVFLERSDRNTFEQDRLAAGGKRVMNHRAPLAQRGGKV